MSPAGRPWRPGHQVRIAVPASSANLGPGFDSVGIGLDLRDECSVTITDGGGLNVSVTGPGADVVPRDERHLVVRSMHRAWAGLGIPAPEHLHLRCDNRVPHGRGLGSSATAIVTGISAAYALAALATEGAPRLDLAAINDLAAHLEGHPDNSSASVYGGVTLSWSDDPAAREQVARTHTVRLAPHPVICAQVLVPQAQLSTATARAVLPATVHLADAAANAARVGLLVHAVTTEPGLLVPATRDYLHQEARRPAYRESMGLVDRFRAAGHAAAISGAGPSVLVLATESVADLLADLPSGWSALSLPIAADGVRLLA